MTMAKSDRNSKEFIDRKQEEKEIRKARFRDILDGSLLTRDNVVSQLPYILFLTLLLILYIGNRYHAERVIRQSLELQTELKELRAKAISTASELEYLSNQSQVTRLIEQKNLGLKYPEEPPVKIVKKRRRKR
jgi:hypothetical protein